MKQRIKLCFSLFWSFAKIGALTFGGGYAMLPMLQRELVDGKNWVSGEDLTDYFAVGQCTPGIIAVNTATFVGFKQAGVLGAVFSTAGIVTPSLIIVSVIAACLTNFTDVPAVQWAFAGIRMGVCGMILASICKLWKGAIKSVMAYIILILSAGVCLLTDLSPIFIVLIAGVCGLCVQLVKGRRQAQ